MLYELLLDRFDLQLLASLQQNAHATNAEIGETLGLSPSQISRRISRLESENVLKGYVALLDPAVMGLGVRAITYVSLTRQAADASAVFEKAVTNMPEVLDCDAVTGDSDYVLTIVAPSLAELSDSILKQLTQIKGVSNVRTNLVLKSIKSTTALPLEHLTRPARTTRRVRVSVRDTS
jgi:Lrp/AsnC family transcriptional regulator, leucine-responsive regulatory protein